MTATDLEPSYLVVPEYYKTFGPEVADLARMADFGPDPEQEKSLDILFAQREDGLSAAFEMALIVGRQNLKTAVFKMATLGWLYLFEERLVVWSAHEFVTAMEALRDLEELIVNNDELRKQTKRITHGNGSEAIETIHGARVIFKTRTKGGGRGLSGRKIILDEAFALHAFHMGALLPLLSAQPDPQLVYGSSAGLMDSDVLRAVRDRGRAAANGKEDIKRLGYVEYCAPPPEVACDAGKSCTHALNAEGCGCDKPKYWLMANPAIPRRISLEYIKSERDALPVGEFGRERMGWWDDPEEGATQLTLNDWLSRGDPSSTPDAGSPLALAIDVAKDRSWSSIALAGWRTTADGDKIVHVELVEHLPGTGWLMDRLDGIVKRRNPAVVMINPASPAGSFEKEMKTSGLYVVHNPEAKKTDLIPTGKHRLHLITARDYAQGCSDLVDAVQNELLIHPDQRPLNEAVRDGRSRPLAGNWAWDMETGKDATPIVAATLAKVGLTVWGKKETPTPFILT